MLNTSFSTLKIFYQSKSTGVHLGLIAKMIESDIFLSGFWDPPSCQSPSILFAFPLILLLLWDEHWVPLTSKACLKHSLAFRIKVRTACQGCTAMEWYGKPAMTASQWQKLNMTIKVWALFWNAIKSTVLLTFQKQKKSYKIGTVQSGLQSTINNAYLNTIFAGAT